MGQVTAGQSRHDRFADSKTCLSVSMGIQNRVRSVLTGLFDRKPEPPRQAREDVWSIGIYFGDSPFHFTEPRHIKNPVLTREDVSDVPASFVADPFMIQAHQTWYLFFEVKNRTTQKGEIALAKSKDGLSWNYQQIVLCEPFHLSYPYVFEWMNDYYMIPETWKAESVRLYKATRFPSEWSFVATLLSGDAFFDSSIVRYNDLWWLFSGSNGQGRFDTLRLHYARDLTGPWIEHPLSPIVKGDPRIARPGGRMLVLKDKIYRYAQDCYPTYGRQIHALEITELTTDRYQERRVSDESVIAATGSGWNGSGMHHVDPHPMANGRWMACVDGWFTT